jgi:dolichol-phosphate mannosyltransferase
MRTFSLVIPIFNEEHNIEILYNELLFNNLEDKIYEIIFVNDCSTDDSFNVLTKIALSNSKIKILNHNLNMGQSACIKTAAQNTTAEILITMDGDGQNDPSDIHKLLEIYNSINNYKLVGGIRKIRKDSYSKRIASKLANKIRILILDDGCEDTGCSLKAFDRKQFLKFPFFDGIHRYLPYLFKKFGCKTFFIEVNHRKRIYGKSKYNNLQRGFRGIIDMIRVLNITV